MTKIFSDIPLFLEEGSLLKIAVNCRTYYALRKGSSSSSYNIEFFYVVRKFDNRPSALPEEGKKGDKDSPTLASFGERWCKYALDDGLCMIL